jgi:superfamily I DNA and/or RNA helicase
LRPDNRPAAVRHQLDEEGVRLLDRLQTELASKVAATRFGRYDVLQRYRDAFDSSRDRVRRAVEAYSSIVGATCQQAASHHMSRLKSASADEAGSIRFNTVIIDEAARANPLDLFIPMSMAKRRIVLVGDHRQLPHLLDAAIEEDVVRAYGEEDRRQVYQQSLFERLWRQLKAREAADGFSRVVMLDTQFRMHPTLGDFVSKNFYESVGLGRIESGRKAEEFLPEVPGFGPVTCAWLDVPARLGREERAGSSRQRICEASRIAKEVVTLLSQLPVDMSVGVITFYAAQRDRIFEALFALGVADTGDSGWQIKAEYAGNSACPERLRVGTVDAFQGKEFDVVLLSTVRSNDLTISAGADDEPVTYEKSASRKYGHLRVSNRLNVAMSRQRRLLIAVGDRGMFVGIEAQRAVPEMAAFVDLCNSEVRHVR